MSSFDITRPCPRASYGSTMLVIVGLPLIEKILELYCKIELMSYGEFASCQSAIDILLKLYCISLSMFS